MTAKNAVAPATVAQWRDLRVGDELPPLSKGPITRQQLVEWCAAENDYYPLHYDERLAEKMQLPGTPVQGTLRYALIGQMLQRWLGQAGTLKRASVVYRGLNLEGEVITARAQLKVIDGNTLTFDVWVENDGGARSTVGEAVVLMA